jgi:predicted Fe-Mo cluster-binding NifX family protein
MKIAVSSTGPELQDLVDPRFGRCRYYIFYDLDTGFHAARENTAGMH